MPFYHYTHNNNPIITHHACLHFSHCFDIFNSHDCDSHTVQYSALSMSSQKLKRQSIQYHINSQNPSQFSVALASRRQHKAPTKCCTVDSSTRARCGRGLRGWAAALPLFACQPEEARGGAGGCALWRRRRRRSGGCAFSSTPAARGGGTGTARLPVLAIGERQSLRRTIGPSVLQELLLHTHNNNTYLVFTTVSHLSLPMTVIE